MSRTAPERRAWRPRTAADGVYYAVARSEEVLAALPVAAADRAAASGLPPWRAAEHTASRTLLRALLRETGEALTTDLGEASAGDLGEGCAAFVGEGAAAGRGGSFAAGRGEGFAADLGGSSTADLTGSLAGDLGGGLTHGAGGDSAADLVVGLAGDLPGGPVAARPGGRPYLPGRPDLGVSLSHSAGWVAAAVGRNRDVGVDVQVPAAVGDRLLRFCCAPADADALTAMAEDRRRWEFAWIFTAQEACVKAVGAGFAARPWTVPVALGQRAGTWRRVRWSAPRERQPVPVACAWTERAGRARTRVA
ncbi:4'-phosphopantetheinyl transferase family protein [Streptomyces sp. NPDC127114]|uniref:4'-phosphopantetheinyl transferase family protein n=1 Tax=Streptomyces sp. NPDC127114 TaxID=3345366 RepID=UPI0036273CA4